MPGNPRLLSLGRNGILSELREVEPLEAEQFPAWTGMGEGHARHASGPETPGFSPGSGFILAQKYVEPFPHFHDFPPWSLLDTLNCRMS